MTEPVRLAIPEYIVITTGRDIDLPEGVLPAGSRVRSYGARTV